ncbi:MAG: hypothetical protein D6806_16240 [Deltaproteobacteria bacterium]|nr:MAG: hypothetical protein D6806_16240 [Deltaproteobacteria bacterium]
MKKVLLVTALFSLSGCMGFTLEEAQEALEEIELASQASALEASCAEIATNFTIGQAVDKAAEEIRDYIASQLPCAEITLDGAKLTVTYGALGGNCTWRGQTFSGSHSITVTSAGGGVLQVDHVWDGLSNQVVRLDGTATVTWNANEKSRNVVHQATWTRLSDGRTGQGSGDRLQQPLPGGIVEGFRVDGDREWTGQSGQWNLEISDVQMRWIDPVPQAGSYVLHTPFGKDLSVSFERVSDTEIRVTISGPRRSFSFVVKRSG